MFLALSEFNYSPLPTLRIGQLLFNHTLNLCPAFLIMDGDNFYSKCPPVASGRIQTVA